MTEALNKSDCASAKDILAGVRADVSDFVKDAEQFDDLTMLCIKYFGPDADLL